MGTVINVLAILAGGVLGILAGKLVSESLRDGLTRVCGVCVLFLGIAGAMEGMLTIAGSSGSGVGVSNVFDSLGASADASVLAALSLQSSGSFLIIASLVVGTLIGEIVGIDKLVGRFGEWLRETSGNAGDGNFIEGFVVTSITVCVGAMAVVGAIEDGMLGDISVLQAKSVLDFIIVMVLACSLGKGCLFSAIPVGLFQGSVTLLSAFIEPVMTDAALANLSLVGSILIFCVGVNLVWGDRIRVANMLPAVVIAPLLAFAPLPF